MSSVGKCGVRNAGTDARGCSWGIGALEGWRENVGGAAFLGLPARMGAIGCMGCVL